MDTLPQGGGYTANTPTFLGITKLAFDKLMEQVAPSSSIIFCLHREQIDSLPVLI